MYNEIRMYNSRTRKWEYIATDLVLDSNGNKINFNNMAKSSDIDPLKSDIRRLERNIDSLKQSGTEINKELVDALSSKKVSASTNDSLKDNVRKVKEISGSIDLNQPIIGQYLGGDYIDSAEYSAQMFMLPILEEGDGNIYPTFKKHNVDITNKRFAEIEIELDEKNEVLPTMSKYFYIIRLYTDKGSFYVKLTHQEQDMSSITYEKFKIGHEMDNTLKIRGRDEYKVVYNFKLEEEVQLLNYTIQGFVSQGNKPI